MYFLQVSKPEGPKVKALYDWDAKKENHLSFKAGDYITVVENEGDELVELPLEEDHTLSLGTLQGQFPGACGLKYRSPETGAWRGLRVTNDVVSQINNDWSGNHCYVVVYPKVNRVEPLEKK